VEVLKGNFSNQQIALMSRNIGLIQQTAATMGFGENTTQMMTSIATGETMFGAAKASEPSPAKNPAINPLQYSGGRATLDLQQNIEGALTNVYRYYGSQVNYAPLATYYLYSDHSFPAMSNFANTYTTLKETAP